MSLAYPTGNRLGDARLTPPGFARSGDAQSIQCRSFSTEPIAGPFLESQETPPTKFLIVDVESIQDVIVNCTPGGILVMSPTFSKSVA